MNLTSMSFTRWVLERCQDFAGYNLPQQRAFPTLYEMNTMDPVANPISGFDALMEEMRIRESTKRALFSIPLHLGDGLTIGIKGRV